MVNSTILNMVQPVINKVNDPEMRRVLNAAFTGEIEALYQAENTFRVFAERRYSSETAATFMKSWHSTHLKMLPIYGLSCRMQKLAMDADEPQRSQLFMAAAHNAETSYEDLNLEAEYPFTHTELYDQLAYSICGSDAWRQDQYCLKQAGEFRRWIYQTMVSDSIGMGLLCNLFSEIYNHGEYACAEVPFGELLQKHYQHSEEEAHKLSLYIRCHVDDNVEEEHFNCVLGSLKLYNQATGQQIDYAKAEQLFRQYLRGSASVMTALEVMTRDSTKVAIRDSSQSVCM